MRPGRTIHDGANRQAATGGMPGREGRSGIGGFAVEQPGDEIDPHRLISEIGDGGVGSMGVVERRRPSLHRVVPKRINPSMDSRAGGQALAVMDHPNIARAGRAGHA